MWFGDLVTMKWWNDLWLKESFADFCGLWATANCESLNFYNPELRWLMFKTTALEFDTKPATHPILAPVPHTEAAVDVFDQISYDKGASWIYLTVKMLGIETVRKGAQIYLHRYQYKNTTLPDFINCLEEANEDESIDVKAWSYTWLKTAGAPSLKLEEGEVTTIVQGFADHAEHTHRS
jgi:aminopeptidase N